MTALNPQAAQKEVSEKAKNKCLKGGQTVAYLKLTGRLRRMMEEITTQMRVRGFHKVDMRWMEKFPELCPVCGTEGNPIGTISAVGAPEAGMVFIPYCICQGCVDKHYNPVKRQFTEGIMDRIQERIFAALAIDPMENYMHRVPESLQPHLREALQVAADEGMGSNLTWIQKHTLTCPACGSTDGQFAKVGFSIVGLENRLPVVVPYLICTGCSGYSDEQLNGLVQVRLLEALGIDMGGPSH